MSLDRAIGFAAGDIVALVVLLFASAKAEKHFDVLALEVQLEWNERIALARDKTDELHDLPFMKEKLFFAQGIAVKDIALLLGADMYAEGKDLAVPYVAVGVLEIGTPGTQGFDLRAEQSNTGLVRIFNKIIVMRLAVFRQDAVLFLMCVSHTGGLLFMRCSAEQIG